MYNDRAYERGKDVSSFACCTRGTGTGGTKGIGENQGGGGAEGMGGMRVVIFC